MSEPTHRDRVWNAALRLSITSTWFDVADVLNVAGLEETQRRTARRTLHAMNDMGWIEPRWPGAGAVVAWRAGDRLDELTVLPDD